MTNMKNTDRFEKPHLATGAVSEKPPLARGAVSKRSPLPRGTNRKNAPARGNGIPLLSIAAALLTILLLLPDISFAQQRQRLTMVANQYTPLLRTGDNPRPLYELDRIRKEFEALHPNVSIEFIQLPAQDMASWLTTQSRGFTAPDIITLQAEDANQRAQETSWFVNLDPYLNRPNPYAEGNERWIDLFYEDATNARRAPDGSLYVIPVDQVATAIFYNKDLFAKAGIEEIPRNWEEFIEVQQRLKKHGIIPFCMAGGFDMRINWAWRIMLDQLYNDLLFEMDVREITEGGFAGVDTQEFVRAYKLGIFDPRSERFLDFYRILRDWSQYWQPGFLGESTDRLFRQGYTAMWWDGSWMVDQLLRDKALSFEWATFPVPPLTPETSRFVTRTETRTVGGATGVQYAITESAERRGNREIAIDFLRYITAPQNLGPMVAEAGMFLPNVKGTELNPRLAAFAERLKVDHVRFGDVPSSQIFNDQWWRTMQPFLYGYYTLEEMGNMMDGYFAAEVDRLLEQNQGVWRWDENWEILPSEEGARPPRTQQTYELPYFAVFIGVLFVWAVLYFVMGRGAGERRRRASRKISVYFFILPTFALLLLFSYYPVLSALARSFTEWTGAGQARWVGMRNYIEVFRDPVVIQSTGNLLKLTAWMLFVGITVPIFVAELIFALKSKRSQYFYRVLFVSVMVVPGIVSLLIWQLMYNYNLGVFNRLFEAIGLGEYKIDFLGNPGIALYSLMFMGFPWVSPISVLIFFAGLQAIPQSVLESAQIDGASGWTRFRHFDLPLLMGQVKLMLVFGIIGSIQGYMTQMIMTGGGPGYSTMVPGLHMYQNAVQYDRMGYACALGTVMFLVILGLTYLNMKYIKSSTDFQAT